MYIIFIVCLLSVFLRGVADVRTSVLYIRGGVRSGGPSSQVYLSNRTLGDQHTHYRSKLSELSMFHFHTQELTFSPQLTVSNNPSSYPDSMHCSPYDCIMPPASNFTLQPLYIALCLWYLSTCILRLQCHSIVQIQSSLMNVGRKKAITDDN